MLVIAGRCTSLHMHWVSTRFATSPHAREGRSVTAEGGRQPKPGALLSALATSNDGLHAVFDGVALSRGRSAACADGLIAGRHTYVAPRGKALYRVRVDVPAFAYPAGLEGSCKDEVVSLLVGEPKGLGGFREWDVVLREAVVRVHRASVVVVVVSVVTASYGGTCRLLISFVEFE